jgi:hypothetical protein
MVTGMTVGETGILFVVNMEVVVLRDVIFHSFVHRYQCFAETCYLFRRKLSPFSLTLAHAFLLRKQTFLVLLSPISRRLKLK